MNSISPSRPIIPTGVPCGIFRFTRLELTDLFIKQYVRELKWKHASAAYIQRQLSVLRSFCSWAVDQRFLRVDPVKKVPLPKLSAEYRREALTKEEAEKLLSTLRYDDFYELRDALLISLILGSGTRLIELHRANVGDFVRKQGVGLLYLQGKGREAADSFVVLVPEIADLMERYLRMLHPSPKDPRFTAQKRFQGRRLSVRGFSRSLPVTQAGRGQAKAGDGLLASALGCDAGAAERSLTDGREGYAPA